MENGAKVLTFIQLRKSSLFYVWLWMSGGAATEKSGCALFALIPFYVEQNTINTNSVVADVYEAILGDDLNEALQMLKVYLASVPYAENATSEGHFQTMLYVVFSLLGRYVQMEVRTARGRIDMVLQTNTDLYVMELKIDHPAAEALQQIDKKGYLLPFEQSGLRLHKVGISFSTKERTLSEWQIVNS